MPIILFATLIIAGLSLYFVYKDKIIAVFGALLYGLMPYRLYVYFEQKDMGRALFWMFLPLIFLCLAKLYQNTESKKRFLWIIPSVIVMASVSRADCLHLFILCGLLFVMGIFMKRYLYLPIALVSLAGSLIVNTAFWKFILLGHLNECAVESELIASKGYFIGNFLMCWIHADGLPGLGFGLLFAIALLLWYFLTKEDKDTPDLSQESLRNEVVIIAFSILLGFLSMHLGIWDIAERVHPIFLRLISSFGSPNVMFGFGCAFLCIPASKAYKKLWDEKNTFVARIIPAIIVILNITSAVYQTVTALAK